MSGGRLTERQVGLGALILLSTGSALLAIFHAVSGAPLESTAAVAVSAILCGGLLYAYWRGWKYANYAVVLLTTLLVIVATTEPFVTKQVTLSIFIPPVLALILTSPTGVAVSGILILISLVVRNGGNNVYTDPNTLTLYIMVIGGMTLARHITDGACRRAESNAAHAEASAKRAADQAREVAEANDLLNTQLDQQKELLDLVSTLESPVIRLYDGLLLAPIVGNLDARRAQDLTRRLLDEANRHHARMVVMDIAGVAVMDTSVAQSLLQTAQSLRLLGCDVTISGISAAVAITITSLGVDLQSVSIARDPQEAMQLYLLSCEG